MAVIASYIAVIIIWSTTPIAIKLSCDSLSPIAAINARICIASILMTLLVIAFRRVSLLKTAHWKIYLAASIGLFPNMPVVYLAAQTIHSGMIAVIFALTPITSGLMASVVLQEKFFSWERLFAFMLAMAGLIIIFMEQFNLDQHSIEGMLLMLCSTVLFSISQVAVKYYQRENKIDPVEQTLGGLSFSLPGLIMTWALVDGVIPGHISATSMQGILYLSIVGSLFGFVAYFYVLTHLSVSVVSLIPLVTPVLALWLGAVILNEAVTEYLQLGTVMIILGLAVYDGLLKKCILYVRDFV